MAPMAPSLSVKENAGDRESRRLMRRWSTVSLAAVAAALVPACGFSPDNGGSSAPPASTAPAAELQGTLWYLKTIAGTYAQPGGRLMFGKAGKLAGSTGCNDFDGTYVQSGSSLTITIGFQTEKACAPPLEAQETAVLAALANVASFSNAFKGVQSLSASDPLTLLDGSGQPLLDYGQGGPETLIGAAWQVTSINTGQAIIPVTGSTLTATFSPEKSTVPTDAADGGTVTGSAGCNSYSAPFQLAGNRLTVGPVVVTRMRCKQPAGLIEQKAAFLKVLEAPMKVVPTSRGMTVMTGDDFTGSGFAGQLELEPVDL